MVKLNSILEKRCDILEKAKVFGFRDIKLNIDLKEGLLFIVTKSNSPNASANYTVFLRKALEIMLGCEVTVKEQTMLRAKYREEILAESVSLAIEDSEILQILSSQGIENKNVTFPEAKISEEERRFYQSREEEIRKILAEPKQVSEGFIDFLSIYSRKRSATQMSSEEDRKKIVDEELLAEKNKGLIRWVLLKLPQTVFDEIQGNFKKAKYSETLSPNENFSD